MLTRPTVLVLGAGASQPFGFPAGATLASDVVVHLRPGYGLFEALNEHSRISEQTIMNFRHRFQTDGNYSIDAFLEGKDEPTVQIGKTAIAYELIRYEDHERLFSFQDNWLREMCSQLRTSVDKFAKNKLSFITYNYDRSVEHFLFSALNSQSQNEMKARMFYSTFR